MKVAFFELEEWEEQSVRAAFPDAEIVVLKGILSAATLPDIRDFDVAVVFVDSKIDSDVIAALPNLKCIATRSTGYDHIDLPSCREHGITVLYVPGYGDNTVAEFAFGLILSLSRKIYQSIDQIKETESFSLEGLRGFDLKGRTIGIIGTGRIGKEMIKVAQGFGMKVVAYDPYPDAALSSSGAVSYMTLDELLATADIVSLHCPANKLTQHLLNSENMKRMKRGSYLVNTARGDIVETDALVAALAAGTLAGAALDVLEEEGDLKNELTYLGRGRTDERELRTILEDHVLMKMPNVLITPHNAFNAEEALKRISDATIANLRGFIDGHPVNIVPELKP